MGELKIVEPQAETDATDPGGSALPLRAPKARLLFLEQRAAFELGAFFAAAPWLRLLGRGDRHPVLVLPGFTTGDLATTALRWQLRSWGYWAHGWRLGTNFGPTPAVVAGIQDRLSELHERHGRTVTLIGWSLGGIYARDLARRNPDAVRSVITLGSPFRMNLNDRSSVSALVDRLSSRFDAETVAELVPEEQRPPLTVPATSIYSKTDGIVRWQACIEAAPVVGGPGRENIEVLGSHAGLGFNPAVLLALADRLRRPEGEWKPFRAPGPLRRWYPEPTYWASDRVRRR